MNFELIILEGPQAGQRLPIGEAAMTFGRSLDAAYSFPQDNFMSGTHLTVRAGLEGLLLYDMRSTNGSFLNGQRIKQAIATNGDIIRIGSLVMQVSQALEERPTISDRAVSPPIIEGVPHTTLHSTSPSLSKGDTILQVLGRAEGTLFCLLDAAADEMIPALLQVAQEQVQSLYEGDSARGLARWAPYLLRLPQNSPLLKVLIDKGWGKGWASFFTATAPFEDLRKHFRRFLMVQIENGKEVYFRFYDPRVLRDFLPTTNRAEMTTFFGPVLLWIVEAPDPNEILLMRVGPAVLEQRVIATAKTESHT